MATRLDFRPVYRQHAKRELDAYARDIESSRPPERGGKPGGSLAAKVRRLRPKLKRWGYVIPYHQLGQLLTWFVRGKRGQPPRPVNVSTNVADLSSDLQARAVQQFEDVDRRFR